MALTYKNYTFKVGDRVLHTFGRDRGTIVYFKDENAYVKWDSDGEITDRLIILLELIEDNNKGENNKIDFRATSD